MMRRWGSLDRGLFATLRRDAGSLWTDFVEHEFVRAIGRGTLPHAAFARYLTQDYLFLIQFARAYALAGYKSRDIDDLRAAASGFDAILRELPLHVSFSAGWGITESDMQAEPEALETIAYTRFVLDRGAAGDLLDLQVVLAPCILGYAEIGRSLAASGAPDNPYAAWIATYASDDYARAASSAIDTLDRLAERSGATARLADLQDQFNAAVRLETAFWEMGWRAREPDAATRA